MPLGERSAECLVGTKGWQDQTVTLTALPELKASELQVEERRPLGDGGQIFVKTLSGETITLDFMQGTDTIQSVKAEIQFKEGVPADTDYRMRLLLKGKRLEDERTLADYGVRDQAVLHRRLD